MISDEGQNGSALGGGGPPRTKICVYCGASAGSSPAHMEMARQLARAMAANNIDLVYGGGTVGLMGEVAKTLCELSGPDSVHGIIPEALVKYERDGTYQTLNADNQIVPDQAKYGRTTVVADMHTRKKLMAEEVFAGAPGSGFIALSGGYGTMEEIFETITWNQLGIHSRGICLLNVDGYWDGIVQWIDKAVEQGFVKQANKDIVVTATTADDAVSALRDYKVSEAIFKLHWGAQ
ncbi:putative lysine decarboxylase domain-containing protein [Hirsutella rhossiliensis]|uniref:Lysine decarboxylase domain-containing protein n=1 Tax=Hirsutella rhossiliensis TaxID=111463 RepID=A0A9P8SKZ6_9HYPO|nr:putative lysine decarboxylase domain-containing protein [Hirsutella rhossiliensis]KAH0965300.1 putative lysine decarboxylase domain-containing protein [Hirsutella rhossiliensis]